MPTRPARNTDTISPGATVPGEELSEAEARKLFKRYERAFNRALEGEIDIDEIASFYAPEFISATPAGVVTGKNDEQLRQVVTHGYAYYRTIGTRRMQIRNVRISPIDQHHCVSHVAWTATYARRDQPDVSIDFDVHYLVQLLAGPPKIFGWVSGDEQALLKERGII